jgi:hypothetical protein
MLNQFSDTATREHTMAVNLEFLNLIIPISVIDSKYLGGWTEYLDWLGDPSECACWHDNYLFRQGAMSSVDIASLMEWWQKKGLVAFEKRKKSNFGRICALSLPHSETQNSLATG